MVIIKYYNFTSFLVTLNKIHNFNLLILISIAQNNFYIALPIEAEFNLSFYIFYDEFH